MFYDRLVDDADRAWLTSHVKEVSQRHFKIDFDELFLHLDSSGKGEVSEHDLHSLMYCDFLDSKADPRPYLEVNNIDKLRKIVEGYLEEYNNMSKKPMNLVLFRYSTLLRHLRAVSSRFPTVFQPFSAFSHACFCVFIFLFHKVGCPCRLSSSNSL